MSIRVLVVDDEPDVSRLIERVLVAEGYDVTTLGDGLAALKRLSTERFDLLIVDVFMPDLDGLGVLRELRSRKDETPVLVVSGGRFSPDEARADGPLAAARAFGASVLPKPFSVDELLTAVRNRLA